MLICQCNVISEADIEAIILDLLRADPWQIIVPAKVFHILNKRGKCCACLPNVVDLIVKVTESYHRDLRTPADKLQDMRLKLAGLDARIERKAYARRRTGHRTTQRGAVSRAGRSEPVLGSLPAS